METARRSHGGSNTGKKEKPQARGLKGTKKKEEHHRSDGTRKGTLGEFNMHSLEKQPKEKNAQRGMLSA